MKSYVLKGASVVISVLISCFTAYAECRCTCMPNPPGGTTHCSSGIAVCGRGGSGGCEGRCINVSGTTSLELAASALAGVLGGTVTSEDLRSNRAQARDAISSLLGSRGTTVVTISFNGNSTSGTFGVDASVADTLRDALNDLSAGDVEVIVTPNIPELPSEPNGSNLERYRRDLEKYRQKLENERKTRDVDVEVYKEGIDAYKEGIDQYKKTVRELHQTPPDT